MSAPLGVAVAPALPIPPAVGTEVDVSPADIGTGGGAGGSACFAGVLSGALGRPTPPAAATGQDTDADAGATAASSSAVSSGASHAASRGSGDSRDAGDALAADDPLAAAAAAAVLAVLAALPNPDIGPPPVVSGGVPTGQGPTSTPTGAVTAATTAAAPLGPSLPDITALPAEVAQAEAVASGESGALPAAGSSTAADGSNEPPPAIDHNLDNGPPPVVAAPKPTGHGPTSGFDAPTVAAVDGSTAMNAAHEHARPHLDVGRPPVVAAPRSTGDGPMTGLIPVDAPAAAVPAAAAPAADAPADAPAVVDVPQPALASALGTLRRHGDGSHELTVALHPAELGSVGVTATVRDGAITISVTCTQLGAHAAVDAALPSLRHELAQAGFTAVDVTVTGGDRDGKTPTPHHEQPGATPTDRPDRADDAAPRPARRLARSTALDRLL